MAGKEPKKLHRKDGKKPNVPSPKLHRVNFLRRSSKKMCRNLGSGIVNYGSELVTHSMYEWRSPGAAINHAVGRYRGGVNPYLSIAATGEMTDPELSHVIRSCIFWRRYFKIFACQKEAFLEKIWLIIPKARQVQLMHSRPR